MDKFLTTFENSNNIFENSFLEFSINKDIFIVSERILTCAADIKT